MVRALTTYGFSSSRVTYFDTNRFSSPSTLAAYWVIEARSPCAFSSQPTSLALGGSRR